MFKIIHIVYHNKGRSSPTCRQMTDSEKSEILVLYSLHHMVVLGMGTGARSSGWRGPGQYREVGQGEVRQERQDQGGICA